MTSAEFKSAAEFMCERWRVQLDAPKMNAWYQILQNLKVARLLFVIESFPEGLGTYPGLQEFVERYNELRQREADAAHEEQDAEQRRLRESQAAGQNFCFLCENTGDVFYRRGNCDFHCQCICARGKDLRRWSRYQISNTAMWQDPEKKQDVSLYAPCATDVLDAEEIEIIQAKNKARREAVRGSDSSEIIAAAKMQLANLHKKTHESAANTLMPKTNI